MESRREANRTTNISDVLSTGSMGICAFFSPRKANLGDWLKRKWLCVMIDVYALLHIQRQKTKSAAPQKKTSSEMDVFCIGYLFGVCSCTVNPRSP